MGVGLIGAGPVAQAIHLPAIARLGDHLFVAHVMDIDAGIAETVASPVGAAWSTSVDDLLADPSVEVVVICSPHLFHAEQAIAAFRAGVRAVLCEKPLAMSAEEARQIVDASEASGVPFVVGNMHAYDPGWLAAAARWDGTGATPHTIRASAVLPWNSRFEDLATEMVGRPPAPPSPTKTSEPDASATAGALHGAVMGLAIHDLPLVRRLLPGWEELTIVSARFEPPFGYLIVGETDGRTLILEGAMHGGWKPDWTLEAVGDEHTVTVRFPPSYVMAGSATAELAHEHVETRVGPFEENGYEGEWHELIRLVRDGQPSRSRLSSVDDLRFALSIAEQSSQLVMNGAVE
ncbi:Gfo/Idh/MocA family oxidoreductase [Agromyces protaetiae]|uniref:Gfo/Idh/MocA family oxidoreductase n=1 Tax=Agromyces protaetiae TaxID=2509455 RepID=A0A4P6FI39_9MICO|nr:Gfo/Idh/MocA family oxidoreductase [Agromyces protaetiae]